MRWMSHWIQGKAWIAGAWKRSRLLRAMALLLAACAFAILSSIGAVLLVPFDEARLKNLDVSTVMRDREGRFLRAYLSRDDRWRIPARLERISPWLIKATLATEDKRFYGHHGIDPVALARAVGANLKSGKIVSGASTISMQVAGFAIDSRERTLSRKLKQAFLALQLESRWSKQEILECYFTHASYGGNVCGVEAAARRYFNKTAEELSLGEAALLAGLPQSPERFRPDEHLKAALKRRDHVIKRMAEEEPALLADCERARKFPPRVGAYEVPVVAPHFCDVVKSLYPGLKQPVTTLDLDVQNTADAHLANAISRHRRDGISNGAVVVLANETGDVVALAGSADYWNRYDHGQVNAAFGFRSPGSTLKPFIFARAMDQGLLSPDEMLFDVPVTISGYSPMNYDRKFRGPVPASKALAWSLNIPAIDVLKRIGVAEFRDSLVMNDVAVQVNPKGDQGLALAIGTCSLRLIDLTRAYASLASGGVLQDERWLVHETEPQARGKKWLSREAAGAVLQMLADDSIRSPEEIDSSLLGLKGVAWKTGTSNGFRDAWTFAVTEKYTVGVWLGNMDGKASRALVGGKVAAPIALSLAKAFSGRKSAGWLEGRADMETVQTCLETGLPVGLHCQQAVKGRILSGNRITKRCNAHQEVMVERATGYALCMRCSAGKVSDAKACAIFPGPFCNWLRANVHPWVSQLKPPHNPECSTARFGDPPVIVSPQVAKQIILLEDLPADFQKISLSARTANPSDQLYWFVNGRLAGTAPAYEALQVLPKAGHYEVRCVDEQGRSSQTWFTVETSSRARKQAGWSRLSDSN